MTQAIRTTHHASSNAKSAPSRASFEDKDQIEGFGVRGLAILFIGFAVYLKTLFSASHAEDATALEDPAVPPGSESAPDIAAQTATAARVDGNDPADTLSDATGDLPTLATFGASGQSGRGASLDRQGGGSIEADPFTVDMSGLVPNAQAPFGGRDAFSGPGLPTDSGPLVPRGIDQDTTAPPPNTTDDPTTPATAQPYDLATLFQDLGITLQGRPDITVDRVTDLAIGDLMRDLTLDEFRTNLGQLPQDIGAPLNRLINVLNDDASREAFLVRTGLAQDATLDASYRSDDFDPHQSTTSAQADSGPDLFL
ncbi:MAG: hypothetical protein KGZ72_04735 [Roseovarius sp.]|jgi:hypothetical protein|nr:hypothetical protein [Roseovarius sp.]